MIGSTSRPERAVWDREVDVISRFRLALFIVYLVEAGVVLVVAPWTQLWGRNFFVYTFPTLEPLLASSFTRGAVSGLGIVSLAAAAVEAGRAVRVWHRRRVAGRPATILSAPPDLPTSELSGEICPPSS